MGKNEYKLFKTVLGYDIKNKTQNTLSLINNTLNKTVTMFKWQGLPETVDPVILEKMLQSRGVVAFTDLQDEKDPGFYAFTGDFSGQVNRYYEPCNFVIANPSLKRSHTMKIQYKYGNGGAVEDAINEKCVICKNDSLYQSLIPLISRYCVLINETDLTIYMTDVLTRTQYAITASDEATKASATKFIEDLTAGRLSVIGDNSFIESLKTLPLSNTNGSRFTDLIEVEQYLKGSLLNDIGLDANYNMKRDRLQAGETGLNKDGLTPLIENMLNCRLEFCDLLKTVYGLDVTVELSGAWKKEQTLQDAETMIDAIAIEDAIDNSGVINSQVDSEPLEEVEDIKDIIESRKVETPETVEEKETKEDANS